MLSGRGDNPTPTSNRRKALCVRLWQLLSVRQIPLPTRLFDHDVSWSAIRPVVWHTGTKPEVQHQVEQTPSSQSAEYVTPKYAWR
jgi:hypothetical protein